MSEEPDVILVALGSNIEPELNLPRAASRIGERMEIAAASGVYESAPVGAPGTPPFLNAVLRVETRLGPRTIKFEILRQIESDLGRRRSTDRNAPRTIDLDLILYGERMAGDRDLQLPDPDLTRFAHLAVPAAEVSPDARHPEDGRALADIAASLDSELERRDDLTLVE